MAYKINKIIFIMKRIDYYKVYILGLPQETMVLYKHNTINYFYK